MSHTWKLLPLAVFVALGLFAIGAPNGSRPAQADIGAVTVDGAEVANNGDIKVSTGDSLDVEVTLTGSRPKDLKFSTSRVHGSTSEMAFNFLTCDDDSVPEADDCAELSGGGTRTLVVRDITQTGNFGLSRVKVRLIVTCSASDEISVHIEEAAGGDEFSFNLLCGEVPTPTPIATAAPSTPKSVVVTIANQALGCGNTAIVKITVRGADGQPFAAGTLVNILASLGAVSPTSGQTAGDGSVTAVYTAPQNQGGTATITATAGTASGSASITINCGTGAQPPTTARSGIQPPSTGDGGVATGRSWRNYAGIALIVASVLATMAVVRRRA